MSRSALCSALARRIYKHPTQHVLTIHVLLLSALLCIPFTAVAETDVPKEAQDLLAQANSKEKVGDFRGAASIYDQILDPMTLKTPKQRQAALYKRGQAEVELHAYDKAIQDFSRTLALLDLGKGSSNELAQVYYERGLVHDEMGHFDKAIADYTMCLDFDPGHGRAYNNRAVANYKSEKYREAIADAESYLTLDSTWPEAYFVRGVSKVSLKDRSGIDDLKTAAQMGHPLAKEALQKAGITPGAAEAKPTVTASGLRARAESGDPAAQTFLAAKLVHESGDLAEARRWYQKAAAQNQPLAQLQLGRMFQNGQGGGQSDDEALVWFLKSSPPGSCCGRGRSGANLCKRSGGNAG